ncbi:MAG: ABC transporter permease [Acidobacteria bacterium]|nr:ABC transporter permease [Acidobacteriota bacterium]
MLSIDLRSSLRLLRKQPGFSSLIVLTLAVGIAANTALFSVVNAVLLRPLPYRQPASLVMVWDTHQAQGLDHVGPSPGNFLDWQAQASAFEGMATWYESSRTLRGEFEPEQIKVAQASTDFFRVLGMEPLLGRPFTPADTIGTSFNAADQLQNGDRLVVISRKLWQGRLAGDPHIIGKEISIDGKFWRVMAVMPSGLTLPEAEADAWVPWNVNSSYTGTRFPNGPPRDYHFLKVVARLKPGITLEQAQSNLNSVAVGLDQQFSKTNAGWRVSLVRLQDELVNTSRLPLLALFGAVGFVLCIACANVAGLFLARSLTRQREIAIRQALGASRQQLLQMVLTESLMLSLLAGGLGIGVTFLGIETLVKLAPADIPRLAEVAIDPQVLLFTFVISILTGILFGIAPALHGSRQGIAKTLQESNHVNSTGGVFPNRMRKALVVIEVALAMVLLFGAGLFIRSFLNVLSVDPGFHSANLLVLRVFLDGGSYKDGRQGLVYYQNLYERLRSLPGVTSVAATTVLPMSGVGIDFDRPVWREGEPEPVGVPRETSIRMVTPNYFDTVGIPFRSGRAFTADDRPETPRVLIVNEALVRREWPDGNAVGKRLVVDYLGGKYPYEIVGVVGDARYYGLKSTPQPEIFIPHAQNPYLAMNVVIRTSNDPIQLIQAARQQALQVDPTQPVHSIVVMDQLLAKWSTPDRFAMVLMSLLAVLALVMAATGLYAMLTFLVSSRTREIGVRIALGAHSRDIFRLIFHESSKLLVAGVVIGLAVASVCARLVMSLLFQLSPTDPVTLGMVVVFLIGLGLFAAYWPARRAVKIDPLIALRNE